MRVVYRAIIVGDIRVDFHQRKALGPQQRPISLTISSHLSLSQHHLSIRLGNTPLISDLGVTVNPLACALIRCGAVPVTHYLEAYIYK